MSRLLPMVLFAVCCAGPQQSERQRGDLDAIDDFEEPQWAAQPATSRTAAQEPTAQVNSRESSPRYEPRQMPRRLDRRRGKPVDMDFRNADLANVFRMLATVGGTNIVLAPQVSGTITLRLKDVSWDDAMRSICAAHGLEMVTSGNVTIIRPRQR